MFDYIERRGGGIIFKWGYAALAALLISAVAIHTALATRYQFGSEQLTLSSVNADTVVMMDGNGHEARLRGSAALFFNGGTNTVTYMDRTIQCTVDWDKTGDYVYTFSDGTSVNDPFLRINFEDGSQIDLRSTLSPLQCEEYDLFDRMGRYLKDGNPIWKGVGLGLLALLVMLLGMALLCFPAAFWKRQTAFIVRDGEPTEWAIFSNRAVGLMLVACAFAIPFL